MRAQPTNSFSLPMPINRPLKLSSDQDFQITSKHEFKISKPSKGNRSTEVIFYTLEHSISHDVLLIIFDLLRWLVADAAAATVQPICTLNF